MVPDPTDSDSSGADSPDDPSDATYDVVYRATRDAIWDVVGTATLILFYLALAGIALSIAVAGISQFLSGSGSMTLGVVGVGALSVGLFAAYRIYALATE
ncbi:hypothetical protein SAMN04488063_0313 [Halopelagius inordinatus]|uniref:Uncharacterized protein n=1 Tax=Halopelagius inordinatus TaxID=553467 RepID=A0A1I2LLN5_9EURY|nr:hypothetical protein [Halopelagius inordinatus]SFF79438.1 hypothetical protein SAMN04488063_0313 [Halopelagius inordinatus]